MRNYKLFSWLCGIGLIFCIFGATEAMAQPHPGPGISWLDRAKNQSKVMKSAHKMHKERAKAGYGVDRPLAPPPGHPIHKGPVPKFDKKAHPKGHKGKPHHAPVVPHKRGPKPHRR